MRTDIDRPTESYSVRVCRCGRVMGPSEQPDRRWQCPVCGRRER